MPEEDADYSNRWKILKTAFSRQIKETGLPNGARSLCQPRFWEHALRDETDDHRHFDDLHDNPVKHGLAAAPGAWPHSWSDTCVREGIRPIGAGPRRGMCRRWIANNPRRDTHVIQNLTGFRNPSGLSCRAGRNKLAVSQAERCSVSGRIWHRVWWHYGVAANRKPLG